MRHVSLPYGILFRYVEAKRAAFRTVEQGREYLKRGYITMDEYEEYEDHYKLYSDLGGNGLARRIFEQVDDLPMMPSGIDGRKN